MLISFRIRYITVKFIFSFNEFATVIFYYKIIELGMLLIFTFYANCCSLNQLAINIVDVKENEKKIIFLVKTYSFYSANMIMRHKK